MMITQEWNKLLLNERLIGVDRLAYILTDCMNEETVTFDINGNEEHSFTGREYKRRVVDIVLALIRGVNKKELTSNIEEEFETSELFQLKAEFLKQSSYYFDIDATTEDDNYANVFAQNFPEVIPHLAIQYLFEAFDTATYLPFSLREHLESEEYKTQVVSFQKKVQFADFNLDGFPLISDVVSMIEQGKSKADITNYLHLKGIFNATIGALLHENPYGVEHNTLQTYAIRLRQ